MLYSNRERKENHHYKPVYRVAATITSGILATLIAGNKLCRIGTDCSLVQHINQFSIFGTTYAKSGLDDYPGSSMVGVGG